MISRTCKGSANGIFFVFTGKGRQTMECESKSKCFFFVECVLIDTSLGCCSFDIYIFCSRFPLCTPTWLTQYMKQKSIKLAETYFELS